MAPVFWILAGIIAFIAATNWDDVVSWIEDIFDRVKAKLEALWEEFKDKLKDKLADIIVGLIIRILVWIITGKLHIEIKTFSGGYALPNGQWINEESKHCEVDISEVPDWAKAGIGEHETDVTERYMKELSLTL